MAPKPPQVSYTHTINTPGEKSGSWTHRKSPTVAHAPLPLRLLVGDPKMAEFAHSTRCALIVGGHNIKTPPAPGGATTTGPDATYPPGGYSGGGGGLGGVAYKDRAPAAPPGLRH